MGIWRRGTGMIVGTWLSRKARERFLLSRRDDQAFAVTVAFPIEGAAGVG